MTEPEVWTAEALKQCGRSTRQNTSPKVQAHKTRQTLGLGIAIATVVISVVAVLANVLT
jgi:hypothetical protein